MNLLFKIDSEDTFNCTDCEKIIDFSKSNSFSYTFWELNERFHTWYETTALDLLYLSLAVFATDRLCLRSGASDAWQRNFKLYLPVLNKTLFEANKELLQEMVSFLTGDYWEFHFRERELSSQEIGHKNRRIRKKDTVK